MIRLTTYLGHSDPSNTYWYLEAVPELLDLAMARATADGREAVQCATTIVMSGRRRLGWPVGWPDFGDGPSPRRRTYDN